MSGAVPKRYKKDRPTSSSTREKGSSKKPSSKVNQKNGNSSEEQSACSSGKGLTSTPVPKSGLPFQSFDASAVSDCQATGFSLPTERTDEKFLQVPSGRLQKKKMKEQESKGPVIARAGSRSVSASSTTFSSSPAVKKSKAKSKSKEKASEGATADEPFDEELANAEMDCLFAEYLQAAFLESSAITALQERSAKAVETLHKLLALVQKYMNRLKYQLTYNRVQSFLIEVVRHCRKQEEILEPVLEVIPTLKQQYKEIAGAVEKKKHKLVVEDVILPDEDETADALKKMEEFITQFLEETPEFKHTVSSFEELQRFANAAELLAKALHEGVKKLEEAKELQLKEACLSLGCEGASSSDI